MRKLLMWVALPWIASLGCASIAEALDASALRGGWETAVDGMPHILEFRIRGTLVTGISCSICDDGTTLAFIDGQLGRDALSFTITHVREDGSTAWQDRASARLVNGRLQVTGQSGQPGAGQGAAHFEWTLHRDPRGPAPPAPPNQRRVRPPYLQAAAWEPITPDKLVGVWLAGPGINKQYFVIRRVGNTLRGVACGPCDDPYTMGALEDFFIQGDTVLFTICHEDWGVGPVPYEHHIVAHIARNELRMDATQQNIRRVIGMTLFGPLRLQATHREAGAAARAAAAP
jgi:hypothetical protein